LYAQYCCIIALPRHNNYRIFALLALAIIDVEPAAFKVNNKLLVQITMLFCSNVACTSFAPFYLPFSGVTSSVCVFTFFQTSKKHNDSSCPKMKWFIWLKSLSLKKTKAK